MDEPDYSKFDHISDNEVRKDISDTEFEASQYEAELNILRQDPAANRVRIYMAEGNLSQRRGLIEKLNGILGYRSK